ncbi:hypothetical protein NUH16_003365 [Penicillium rubens]|nr:hypothetical protein NUH16_003365 [Penicillium rubens]
MDHKVSQVSKRSNTPDTEEHNGLTWKTGNESAENFRGVVGQLGHGDRGHTSQVLQLSVDQSTGSVSTEVATSVASSMDYMMRKSSITAERQDLPPLSARKRVADSSTFPRKQRRHSSSGSQIQGGSQRAAQEMYRKRPPTLTTINRKLVFDTIQYLQTLSDRILISDTIFPREWATMHLATQLLQSRYEDIIAREEIESDTVSESTFSPKQPEKKCPKCAAADEEELYD